MTRLNWTTSLKLPGCALVPYRASHVATYHKWMQSPALRAATASEPLTLEEEVANQRSWRDDEHKLTFLIQVSGELVGDVNLFLNDAEDLTRGEVEVMVAVESARRKGIAAQAVAALMLYAARHLKVTTFVAKIAKDNAASLALFVDKLKFAKQSFSEAFNEHTLESTAETLPACRAVLQLSADDFVVESKSVDPQLEALRESGNKAFACKDFTRACEIYDELVELDGRDATARSNRSVSRLKLGEYFGAYTDAYLARHFDPHFSKAPYRMAHALAFMGRVDEALALFDKGAAEFPEQAKAYKETKAQVEAGRGNVPALSPPLVAAVKVSDESAKWDVEIESSPNSRGLRFAAMSYIWDQLSGKERHAVFEEFSRAGFQDSSYIPAPEALDDAKAPVIPGMADVNELSKEFRESVKALVKAYGPLARVAGLSLVFESAARRDRAVAAEVLIGMARTLA